MSKYPSLQSYLFLLKKYGISSSNIYDVDFTKLANLSSGLGDIMFKLKNASNKDYNPSQWLSFYCDELDLPGMQLSTGDYGFNASPNMRYVNDLAYPEMSFTFIVDASLNQLQIFTTWMDYIKPLSYVNNSPDRRKIMRYKYRDEYVTDVRIDKYERFGAGTVIPQFETPKTLKIHPDQERYFIQPFRKYSVTLKNAFPISITNIPLSSGSSQANRITVVFNYEYFIENTDINNPINIIESVS